MKPRVLAITDVPGWAFDRNCRDMAAALADSFDFRFWYMQNGPPRNAESYDAIYCAYRWDLRIPLAHAIGSLRCEVFDATAPGPPTDFQAAEVNRFRAFHTVTRGAFEQLRRRCPQVQYLTNPVDTARFGGPAAHGSIMASWSGHARHPHPAGLDLKGFETIVRPACNRARIPLVYAERVTRPVAPDRMSAFYRRGNVTLCASIVEGASNSVMEGMASGHALISTDCGNVREMQDGQVRHLGAAGIVVVPRSVEAFADALAALTPARVAEMGAINARDICERWSWRAWAPRYEALIRGVL